MNELLMFDRRRTRVKYCPCGKSNKDGKFVPYKGYDTKGYCHSCDHTFLPNDETLTDHESLLGLKYQFKPIKPSFHSWDLQDKIIKAYENQPYDCNLTSFFLKWFPFEEVQRVTQEYYLTGTNAYWNNSTIFWQIDEGERIHAAKIMLYDQDTGKRVKEPYPHINWLHNSLDLKEYNLSQCLFGLHLASEKPEATIGIVESEKTAMMMSFLAPEMLWIATGSKQNLKKELMNPLKGREIILFPDKGEYTIWQQKAVELQKDGHSVAISSLIEKSKGERGTDLADLYMEEMVEKKVYVH